MAEAVDMSNELCLLCGRTRQWHRENETKHEFNAEDSDLRHKKVEPKPKDVRPPSDPILRYVLIEKGLITPEDLTKAETTLQSLGSIVSSVRPASPATGQ